MEIRKSRRRIHRMANPPGDRQAVLAHISLGYGSEKPLVPAPEETLAIPATIVAAGFLACLISQVAQGLRRAEKG
jgi:hypothetical protein